MEFDQKARKTRSGKKIDGRAEAHRVALVCQGPPEGESKWKLQLFAQRLVELRVVEHISSTRVGITPAHGSWLNMPEIECSVLNRKVDGDSHCPFKPHELVQQWQAKRNKMSMSTNGQFTTRDARVKLIKLYPTVYWFLSTD